MKKILTLTLALVLSLSLAACGGSNPPASQPQSAVQSSGASSVASTAPEAIDVSDWTGTYQTTESDEEIIVFIVTAEECGITYRGKTAAAKVKAVHDIGDGAMELQMLDEEDLLHHLVYFPTNEPQKQFSFSVTQNGDPSTQIVNSCFMFGDSPIAKGNGTTASSDASTPAHGSSQDSTDAVNTCGDAGIYYLITGEEEPIEERSSLEIKQEGNEYIVNLNLLIDYTNNIGLNEGSHSGAIKEKKNDYGNMAKMLEIGSVNQEVLITQNPLYSTIELSPSNLRFYKMNMPSSGQTWYDIFVGTYYGDRQRALGYDESYKIEADGTVIFKSNTITYTAKLDAETPTVPDIAIDAKGSDGGDYMMTIGLSADGSYCSVAVYKGSITGSTIISDNMIHEKIMPKK